MNRRQFNQFVNTPDAVTAADATAFKLPTVSTAATANSAGWTVNNFVTVEHVLGPVTKTVLTLSSLPVTITDDGTTGHAGIKLMDFPEGTIKIHSVYTDVDGTMSGSWVATTPVNSIGTATAGADATLTGTEADIVPSTALTETSRVVPFNKACEPPGNDTFDGSSTAKDLYLNFAVNSDPGASATITYSGTITVLWTYLSDVSLDSTSDTALVGAQTLTVDDAATNTITDVLTLAHTTSGTAAAGLGNSLVYQIESAGGTLAERGSIDMVLADATAGTEDADLSFKVSVSGSLTELARLVADSSGSKVLRLGASNNGVLLRMYPTTVSCGFFDIVCASTAGNFSVSLQSGNHGQASTYTIQDCGAATANIVTSAGNQSIGGIKTFTSAIETGTTGMTGSALLLESLNPMTIKLNDTNALQLDNAAIAAFAGAASTAGTDVYVETQDGGTPVADAHGVAGGSFSLKAGDGSAGGAHTANNPNGGNGGTLTLTAGSGGAAGGGTGVAGDPGKVVVGAGTFRFAAPQTIDMANADAVLTLNPGTPAGTTMTSNVLFVDANNSGGGNNLKLPPEADCVGLVVFIANTGGEDIDVVNDADGALATVSTTECGLFMCNGTTWYGGMMTTT